MSNTAAHNAERTESDRGQSAINEQLQQVAGILGKDRATEIIGQFVPAGMEPMLANVPDAQRQALLLALDDVANPATIYIPPPTTAPTVPPEPLLNFDAEYLPVAPTPQPGGDRASERDSMGLAADLSEAKHLFNAGMKLCALHDQSKRPVGNGWNTPENCVQVFDHTLTGYGFPLAINGRCSIDPDQVDMAKIAMKAWGFDYEDVMSAGVRTLSTRPGSGGRSQFVDPGALKWITLRTVIDGVNVTVLELRAGSPNLQDVIPGLLYKDSAGNLCTQSYANGHTFLDAPALPANFMTFWKRMSDDMVFRLTKTEQATAALANAGYKVGVIHDLSGGGLPFPEMNKRLRAQFNAAVSVESILTKHGYIEHRGRRWSSPNATGEPGIRLIKGKDSLWQSDHGSDPLRGTFDAAAASVVLDHSYDEDAWAAWVKSHSAGLKDKGASVEFGATPGAADDVPADDFAGMGAPDTDPRWKFKPLDMRKVMREEPKPIKWLFGHRMPGNRGGLLTGLGGTSKTQMLYQMAVSAILGICPWGWSVDNPGKALLILTEDDENDPHITMHAIKIAMGLSEEQALRVAENLIVYPLAGENLKLLIRDPDSNSLIGSGYLGALEEMIKKVSGVAFVGIDPALGVTEGDEASQTDQRALGRMADNLAVRCDCAVIILTHGTKGSLQSDEITSHSSRGGGAITDAVRVEYGMRTMTAKEAPRFGINDIAERESYVQMKVTKGNRIPPDAKTPIWFHRARGGFLEVVELTEAAAGGISPLAKRVLDTMVEMDPDNNGVRLQDWRQRCADKQIIGGPTPEALKKAMNRAVAGIGTRITKKEGERGIYLRNFVAFDDAADQDDDE